MLESLHAGRRSFRRLLAAAGPHGAGPFADAMHAARALGVPVEETDRRQLDRLTRGGHHQGLALETGPYPYVDPADLLEGAQRAGEAPFLLLLDHVEDPQNVGSLLRSADAAGAHGAILPRDRAVGVTPAVVRASSGAAEHLPVAQVTNLVRAIEELKKAGVWIYGLDGASEVPLYTEARLDGAVGLVVGSEGSGLSRLVRDRCDGRLRLPMRGHVGSLNAAVSGAIALYHVRRLRDAGR